MLDKKWTGVTTLEFVAPGAGGFVRCRKRYRRPPSREAETES